MPQLATTLLLSSPASLNAGILSTLQVGLASLCHNHQWLLDNIPEGTKVKCPPNFCLGELQSLSKEVNCLLPGNDGVCCYLQCATGVPPHVMMMTSKLEELKQQFDLFLPAINSLVEKPLDDRNICGTISANAMKSIIQQELLPVKEAMERANMLSLEAPWFLTDRVAKVSFLEHLIITDVTHLLSGKQMLYKMQLVVNEIVRLCVAAGDNTTPKTPGE
eukprot:4004709-Ditylum_brightwellii.AAC.1